MKKTNYLNQTNYFSRQETLKIVKMSDNNLAYLERIGLIKPIYRDGRKVYYNWYQLLELKIITVLREKVSLQTLKEAIDNLEKYCNSKNLYDKKLVAYNSEIVLLDKNENISQVVAIELTGKNTGQLLLREVLTLNEIINELLDNGKNNIVDFNKRLKAENIDYSGVREAIAS
jgi:DNA-binding transcriptional MerR regulator